MEFLIVGNNKLKVTLTPNECAEYHIDTSGSDFSTSEVRIAVRAILEIARCECGFSTEGEKILAQLYPMPDGSCELLVTKLTSAMKQDYRLARDTEGLGALQTRRGVYRFSDEAALRVAERAILRSDIDYEAYAADSGECYISVTETLIDGMSDLEALIEYGERIEYLPPHVVAERGRRLEKK